MSQVRSGSHGERSDAAEPGGAQGAAIGAGVVEPGVVEHGVVEPGAVALGGHAATIHHLDNRRSSCALGLVRVKQRLSEIPLGDVLEMVTRDRFAAYEVPAWVEREGLELESMRRAGWWLLSSTTFRIRKTTEVAAPRVRA